MSPEIYTRCPACSTVFQLEAGQLAQAAGVVRCGSCHKIFNALGLLFADWPSATSSPCAIGGMPPELPAPSQGTLNLAEPDPEPDNDFDTAVEEPPHEPGPKLVFDLGPEAPAPAWVSMAWPAAATMLALVLVAQSATLLLERPGGLFGLTGDGQMADVRDAVALVSRDLHTHPSLDDAVIVSATLANRGEQPVPYPVIEVQLFDASQQVIGVRRLEPAEYLGTEVEISSGMRPGVLLPVVLELMAAGGTPHGFEFRFF